MVIIPDFNPKQIELRAEAEEARREHERERRAPRAIRSSEGCLELTARSPAPSPGAVSNSRSSRRSWIEACSTSDVA